MRQTKPAIQRLLEKASVTETCWLWTGASTVDGYGSFRFEGTTRRAHRVAYQLLVGPIPNGLHLDHLCRTRSCINPEHLEPVTNQENIARGYKARGRKTTCGRGHLFTPENTYGEVSKRTCRTCALQAARSRYYAAKSAASTEGWTT